MHYVIFYISIITQVIIENYVFFQQLSCLHKQTKDPLNIQFNFTGYYSTAISYKISITNILIQRILS